MLFGFAGFTATKGSTSLLTKFVPGPPTVQLANGLRPETSIGPAAASAIPATAIAAAAVTPAMIQRKRRMPHLPRADKRRAISLFLTPFNARAARRDADQVTRRIAHGQVAKERPRFQGLPIAGARSSASSFGFIRRRPRRRLIGAGAAVSAAPVPPDAGFTGGRGARPPV